MKFSAIISAIGDEGPNSQRSPQMRAPMQLRRLLFDHALSGWVCVALLLCELALGLSIIWKVRYQLDG